MQYLTYGILILPTPVPPRLVALRFLLPRLPFEDHHHYLLLPSNLVFETSASVFVAKARPEFFNHKESDSPELPARSHAESTPQYHETGPLSLRNLEPRKKRTSTYFRMCGQSASHKPCINTGR